MSNFYGPYSNMKFVHHANRIKMARQGLVPSPINVQLVLSNRCNLNCNFCTYRNDMFPSAQGNFKQTKERIIPKDKALEIIKDCVDMGVKSITLTGGGEPAVHPDFETIVACIIDNGIELGLITNGTIMPQSVLDLLADNAFQWVRISLDAGSRETFAKIKGCAPSLYDKACRNIKRLVECKRELKGNATIGVGFVATLDNYKEIKPIALWLKEVGIDSFRIRSVAGTALKDFYGDSVQEIIDICQDAATLSNDDYAVENLFREDIKVIQHSVWCGYQYLHTYIGADLNVYNCCLYAYNDIGVKGNLSNTTFRDFWYSQKHGNYLKSFNPRNCPTCDFVEKNDLLEYISADEPVNVNFI